MADAMCSIEDCSARAVARGWCGKHWARWKSSGDPLTVRNAWATRFRSPARLCSVEDCYGAHDSHGLCPMHRHRALALGDPLAVPGPKAMPTGDQHHSWKGDRPGYAAAHMRVKAARGPASGHPCAICAGPARDWAMRQGAESALDESVSLSYSPRIEDYLPMCRPCHHSYDDIAAKVWASRRA